MKEAQYYNKKQDQIVECYLCPQQCRINEGKQGNCKIRKNREGILYAETYGRICSAGFDPIEKKPLYHYHPGKIIFSVGGIGCNFHCQFCQNWEISQASPDQFNYLKQYTPSDLVSIARANKDNIGLAYTYNEPTVWYEFMADIAKLASAQGLKNVMVTNGFINEQPLQDILPVMDAFSVDLKSFSDNFYRKLCGGRLEPVKNTLKEIRKSGKHLEITNLIITAENDDEHEFRNMVEWIGEELGSDTVLHISAYYPSYKMNNPPTPYQTLAKLYRIAGESLDYVFMGNVSTTYGQHTFCNECKEMVISRNRYKTQLLNLNAEGECGNCGNKIITN